MGCTNTKHKGGEKKTHPNLVFVLSPCRPKMGINEQKGGSGRLKEDRHSIHLARNVTNLGEPCCPSVRHSAPTLIADPPSSQPDPSGPAHAPCCVAPFAQCNRAPCLLLPQPRCRAAHVRPPLAICASPSVLGSTAQCGARGRSTSYINIAPLAAWVSSLLYPPYPQPRSAAPPCFCPPTLFPPSCFLAPSPRPPPPLPLPLHLPLPRLYQLYFYGHRNLPYCDCKEG